MFLPNGYPDGYPAKLALEPGQAYCDHRHPDRSLKSRPVCELPSGHKGLHQAVVGLWDTDRPAGRVPGPDNTLTFWDNQKEVTALELFQDA